MNFYKETYLGNLMQGYSQWMNAHLGGAADISISARLGYQAVNYPSKYWIASEALVNTAFRPIDGEWQHCLTAYHNDSDENYKFHKGGKVSLFFLSLILLIVCLPLGVVSWITYGIKKCVDYFKK